MPMLMTDRLSVKPAVWLSRLLVVCPVFAMLGDTCVEKSTCRRLSHKYSRYAFFPPATAFGRLI